MKVRQYCRGDSSAPNARARWSRSNHGSTEFGRPYASRKQPLDLMVDALERAALDSGAATMLENIEEIVAVSSFTWHTNDPALLVAQRLGLNVTTRLLSIGATRRKSSSTTPPGGSSTVKCTPSRLWAPRRCTRDSSRAREGRELDWTLQRDDVVSPLIATNDPAPLTAAEYGQGLNLPTNVYPLFRERSTRALGLDDPGATRAPRSTLVQFRARRCDESLRLDPRRAVGRSHRHAQC